MFPWRPITITRRPPAGVLTIEECRYRQAEKARQRLKRMGRCKDFPPPSRVLHFAMWDANMRRLRRYRGRPVRRGSGRLRGWTRWLMEKYPWEMWR